jgi:hypothetical protein
MHMLGTDKLRAAFPKASIEICQARATQHFDRNA